MQLYLLAVSFQFHMTVKYPSLHNLKNYHIEFTDPCVFHRQSADCVFQGSARRKRKVIHRTNATDDKKLQGTLRKLGLTAIPGIEEVRSLSCMHLM